MKKIKLTKENIALTLIVILSGILSFVNLSIEGYGNSYYAAAVKSMTMSLKNFFFVAFDPSGFVTIDKPPLGFWLQAISTKIFGYSGVSILLPSAIASVISVILIHRIVKRSFGTVTGLISALFLAITPVFVAVSRNNTIDNILILFLLLALWALSIAAEKGKFKYLIIAMVMIGLGFNVKMLEAYLVVPAVYVTYLFATTVPIKKRIVHLIVGTIVLVAVSLSWALVVDAVPASSRPYVDSSTNNTVMELIFGHNGIERISLGSSSSDKGQGDGPGGQQGSAPSGQQDGQMGTPPSFNNSTNSNTTNSSTSTNNSNTNSSNENTTGNAPSGFGGGQQGRGDGGFGGPGGQQGGGFGGQQGGGPGGNNSSQLQGSFGGQVKSSITRLFSKNILSDQIVWFIPLAAIGFIAAAIKEKLTFRLNTSKKQALALWFLWFFPEFIYFSFNTGTFHPYYLTMLAPPVAALAGIGISSMWELYKEGGWKAWFLPRALLVNGAVHISMLCYFISYSNITKVLIVLVAILSILSSLVLVFLNLNNKLAENNVNIKRTLVALALVGLILTPLVGSSTVLTTKVNNSFPAAGLELLSSSSSDKVGAPSGSNTKNAGGEGTNANSKLIQFLEKNKTTEKYLLVVQNSNSASDIIINTGESVMSLGGFLGSDQIVTLDQFKTMVKNGEIRYVMTGGMGGGGNSSSEIMNWVEQNGTLVDSSEYSDTNTAANSNNASNATSGNTSSSNSTTYSTKKTSTSSSNSNRGFGGGGQSEQLYDLKAYTDSQK